MKPIAREPQLDRLRQRDTGRHKQGKGRLLDELCEHYGYDRKYAIKLLRAAPAPRRRTRGRDAPPRYAPIHDVLTHIWQKAEQLCGKRLVSALPLWLPHYPKHFGALLPSQQKLRRAVSAATVDRLLADQRAAHTRGLCGTKPGRLLRTQIPIQGEVWNEHRVGFLEADSVAHCGGSLAGDFVWSLTDTDLACTWTAGRAVWNKGATGVLAQTQDVEPRLPFAVPGFDFDNGSEWLNWHLLRFLQQPRLGVGVRVSRSRPYHADDNAHVEQKNWMWPRQLLGYGRLGAPHVVPLINAVYLEVWEPRHNFFLPSMKLRAKCPESFRGGCAATTRRRPPTTGCWPAVSWIGNNGNDCATGPSRSTPSRWPTNWRNGSRRSCAPRPEPTSPPARPPPSSPRAAGGRAERPRKNPSHERS